MHPAYSVIFFTTSSGAGYGLLFWLSWAQIMGRVSHTQWPFIFALSAALALITAGLLSSTFHLGHPERAWRAFSQWRSSWLSREGVAAVLTYVPAGLLWLSGITRIGTEWAIHLAALSMIGAAVTVFTTGMIYASLRTIAAWNMRLVPMIYLALAASTGYALWALYLVAFGALTAGDAGLGLILLGATAAMKWHYLRRIDGAAPLSSLARAFGWQGATITPLDPPHTRPNFVMREMGFQVGRKHAQKLRKIMFLCLFLLPIALIAAAGAALLPAWLSIALAVLLIGIGVVVERWLFFAEAKHISQIFYP